MGKLGGVRLLVRHPSAAWAAFLGLASFGLASLLSETDAGAFLWVLVCGVVVLGLPHGAADPWVASVTCHRYGFGLGRVAFLAAYTGLALLVVAAWSLWPLASLSVFLLISIVHFGLADTRRRAEFRDDRWLATLQRGLLPIALPIEQHSSDVAAVFGELVGVDPAGLEPAVEIGGDLGVVALGLLSVWLLLRIGTRVGPRALVAELTESAGLAAIFLLLPLLPAFGLYFGAWHSVRHLVLLRETLVARSVTTRTAVFGMITIWIAAVAFIAAAPELLGSWAPSQADLDRTVVVGVDVLPAIFVGLAALTVPHVLLTDLLAGRSGTWAKRVAHSTPESDIDGR